MKMVDRLRSYKNDVHSEFFMEVADHIEKQERMIKLMKMDIDRNKHNDLHLTGEDLAELQVVKK